MSDRSESSKYRRLLREARAVGGPQALEFLHEAWARWGQGPMDVEAEIVRKLIRSMASTHRRAARRRQRREAQWASEHRCSESGANLDPSHSSRHADVRRALKLLSEQDAKMVIARYVLEATSSEISTMLGLSPNTIRWRLSRALSVLQLGLAGRQETDGRSVAMYDEATTKALIEKFEPLASELAEVWTGRLILDLSSDEHACRITSVRFLSPSTPPPDVARRLRRRLARLRLPATPQPVAFEAHFDLERE